MSNFDGVLEHVLAHAVPEVKPSKSLDQIAALPLGSRVQVNAWDGTVSFNNRKVEPLIDASEKMPFRVTPVIPYLKTFPQTPKTIASAGS